MSIAPAPESPGQSSQDQNPGGPLKPQDTPAPKTEPEKLLWHYEHERAQFLPLKPPAGWNDKDDIEGYIEIWGEAA